MSDKIELKMNLWSMAIDLLLDETWATWSSIHFLKLPTWIILENVKINFDQRGYNKQVRLV